MSDLSRTLTEVAERGTPIGSASLRERVMLDLAAEASASPRRRFSASRPAWAFLGAAAVMLVLLGVVPLLLRTFSDGASVAATTMVTTAPVPTTTAPPTTAALQTPTSAPAIELTWTSVGPDGVSDLTFSAVAIGQGRLVAAGDVDASEAENIPNMVSIWISDDGQYWTEINDPSFLPESGWIDPTSTIAAVHDVGHGVGGFVAVGQMGSDGAIWTSETGSGWQRLDLEVFGGDGLQEITGITSGETGWVAYGRSELDGQAWTSTDGRTWQSIADLEGVALSEVIADATGFVAVGTLEGDGATWVSTDGVNWDLAAGTAFDPVFPNTGHIAVNPDDGRMIGLDYYGVWGSGDGRTWAQLHEYDGYSDVGHPDGTAIWYQGHIIASDPDTGMWSSSDGGTTWVRRDWIDAGLDGGVAMFTEFNGELIAVGDSIWIGQRTS